MTEYFPFGVSILTIGANLLSGNTVKNTSIKYENEYKNTITPVSYTFIIWGIIYILLLVSTFKNRNDILNIKTSYGSIYSLFILSCILNILWILLWDKNVEIASFISLLLAIVLVIILYELNKANVDKLLLYTFGIYAMWAVIACILNLSIVMNKTTSISNNIINIGVMIILSIMPFIVNKHFNKSKLVLLLTIIWASGGIVLNKHHNLIFIIPILSAILNLFI